MDNIFNIITNLIVFVPIIVIFSIMPYITRKDIMFGITIPSAEWKNDYFSGLRKRYVFVSVMLGVILFAGSILATAMLSEQLAIVLMQVLMWGMLIAYLLLYLYFWNKVKKYKQEAGWQIDAKNIAAADTSVNYERRTLPNVWFIVYIVVIAATYLGALRLYEFAPEQIAMQYDLQGNVTRYAQKSMSIIYQFVGIQVFMGALFFFINVVIRRAKKIIDPNNPQKSSMRSDVMKYRWSIFLFITGLLMLLIFAEAIAAMFVEMPLWITIVLPLVTVMLILVYAIVLSVKTGQSGNRIKESSEDTEGTGITRDDDSLWKLGMFYYNKDDPAVFVEKRFGAGWTNNWAKWQSWLFMAVILALIAVSIFFSI